MSSANAERSEQELIQLAQHGDRRAFDELMAPRLPQLRGLVRRLVGDPQDTADLIQDTLVRAYTGLGKFRGESKLTTWLYTIASRLALDHLSSRRVAADVKVQLKAHVHADPGHSAEINRHFVSAEFDAREHIAFCFGCVSRSLPADEQVALVLRDVLELSNDEAAKILEVSTSVLRHRLARARTEMQTRYEGLCRLVSKTGVCYQCEGLRGTFSAARQGPPVPVLAEPGTTPDAAFRRRLAVVRSADIEHGAAQTFHDFLWRALASMEAHG